MQMNECRFFLNLRRVQPVLRTYGPYTSRSENLGAGYREYFSGNNDPPNGIWGFAALNINQHLCRVTAMRSPTIRCGSTITWCFICLIYISMYWKSNNWCRKLSICCGKKKTLDHTFWKCPAAQGYGQVILTYLTAHVENHYHLQHYDVFFLSRGPLPLSPLILGGWATLWRRMSFSGGKLGRS